MARHRKVPDWEKPLAHAATLQTNVPGAVLVGGTAAAVHVRHRYSVDHDHVIKPLASHYDKAFASLQSIAGWRTNRKLRGKPILGEVHGIAAGLRNQRRAAPLETGDVEVASGRKLRIPTVEDRKIGGRPIATSPFALTGS